MSDDAPPTDESIAESTAESAAAEEERELAELRARNALLEAEVSTLTQAKRHRVRWVVATVFIALGAILVPAGIVTPWLRSEVLNTDNFVATFGPLAKEPVVQEAAATAVTDAIVEQLDLQNEIKDVLPDRAKVLAGPISNGVEGFIKSTALDIFKSERFITLWNDALRTAHESVVALLRDEKKGPISIAGGKVVLNLSEAAKTVQKALVDKGLTIVEKLPVDKIQGQIVLFQSQALENARTAVALFVAISWLLPFLAIGLLVIGALIAPDRRRGALWAAIGLFLGALVVAGALGIGRTIYIDQVKSAVAGTGRTGEVAILVFDRVVVRLKDIVRGVAVFALLAAAVAFFAGSSKAAVRARSTFGSGAQWLSGRVVPANPSVRDGLVWTNNHRRGLELALVGIGALWLLVFAGSLSMGRVLWTAFFVLVGVFVVETASRSGAAVKAAASAPNPDEPSPAATN